MRPGRPRVIHVNPGITEGEDNVHGGQKVLCSKWGLPGRGVTRMGGQQAGAGGLADNMRIKTAGV